MSASPPVSRWLRAGFCSPRGLLVRAALIGLGFLIVHIAGWREHTTFISGTTSSPDASINTTVTLGLIYLISYFGFVLGAPILVIGAGLLKLWNYAAKSRCQE